MTATPARMAASAFHRGATLADPDGLFDIGTDRLGPGSHDLRLAICAGSVDPVDTRIRTGRVAGSFDRSGGNAQFHLVDGSSVGRMPETLGAPPGKPADAGVPHPLDTTGRIDAHRLVEGGGNTGKMVAARSVEDAERCTRETGR